MKQSKISRPSIWLIIALILTLIYFIFVWFAVDVTPDIADKSRSCIKGGWIADAFGCLTMNEFGDFFAGAFAPLAFIWLVAAVLIQSQELSAQREELRVANDQAEATNKTLSAQTRFIEKQTEINMNREKNEIYKAAMQQLALQMGGNPHFSSIRTSEGRNIEVIINVRSARKSHLDDEEFISHIATRFNRRVDEQFIQNHLKDGLSLKDAEQFRAVVGACDKALFHFEEYPMASQIKLDALNLFPMLEKLHLFADAAEVDISDVTTNVLGRKQLIDDYWKNPHPYDTSRPDDDLDEL